MMNVSDVDSLVNLEQITNFNLDTLMTQKNEDFRLCEHQID